MIFWKFPDAQSKDHYKEYGKKVHVEFRNELKLHVDSRNELLCVNRLDIKANFGHVAVQSFFVPYNFHSLK